MREGQKRPSVASRLRKYFTSSAEGLAASAAGVQARLNDDGSSFSGGERDHLFLSDGGRAFLDVSAVSGLDSPADGRSFVVWDYDRDGWIDIALTNANAPRLELYRNAIGDRGAEGRGVVAFRFVGGNRTAASGSGWSARDGYGARMRVDFGGSTIQREQLAGTGLAAQNSATLLVGIGAAPSVKGVTVFWPSGRVQQVDDIPAGTLVTVYEDATRSPDGSGAARAPYRLKGRRGRSPARSLPAPDRPILAIGHEPGPEPRIRLYTTFATWCGACREEAPDLVRLRGAFSPAELGLYAIPIDPEDPPARVEAWMAEVNPPYELLRGMPPQKLAAVKDLVLSELKQDAVPATFLTDARGRLLAAQWGAPTVSRIRELLASLPPVL